jgi:hypothetical protein
MKHDLGEPVAREREYLEGQLDDAVEQGSISEIAALLRELAGEATTGEDSPRNA